VTVSINKPEKKLANGPLNSILEPIMRALVLGILIATSASAQQVYSVLHCDNWPKIKLVLDQNGEEPALRGLSSRQINEQVVNLETILFVNPQNGNYTVVEHWSTEMFCVVQSGATLRPYKSQ
jgi:hypothetical protein